MQVYYWEYDAASWWTYILGFAVGKLIIACLCYISGYKINFGFKEGLLRLCSCIEGVKTDNKIGETFQVKGHL